MTAASKQININAPTDRVFDYLVDVERHVEWSGALSYGLKKINKVTPGPLKPGSVFKSLGLLSSETGVEDTSTVTEVEPYSRLTWETVSTGDAQQNTFRWAYTMEPQGNGTRLTYSLLERRFNPKPLPMWFPPLIWLVDHKVFGREMAGGLQKIKETMEQRGFIPS
jgi:uncharacterized protein YndB with AHSA1/START domain